MSLSFIVFLSVVALILVGLVAFICWALFDGYQDWKEENETRNKIIISNNQ